jgi:low affinity Fe/Cu permease
MADEQYDKVELLAGRIVRWASASHTLLVLVLMFVAWFVFGPLFKFSEEWQSSMTLPATAITFLLVFLILRAQNKDTRAIQLKLNEIIAALSGANNELIDIENMSERTLEDLHKRYETVAAEVKSDQNDIGKTDAIITQEVAENAPVAEEIVETEKPAIE